MSVWSRDQTEVCAACGARSDLNHWMEKTASSDEEAQRRLPVVYLPCSPPVKPLKIGPVQRGVWDALSQPEVPITSYRRARLLRHNRLYLHHHQLLKLRAIPVLHRSRTQWKEQCTAKRAAKAAAKAKRAAAAAAEAAAAAKKPPGSVRRRRKAEARAWASTGHIVFEDSDDD